MRAYYYMGKNIDCQYNFEKALKALNHHWGSHHPLNITIYGILAFLMTENGHLEEAELLHKSSLICCLQILGKNHIQTADVYMDFGRLYLKMNNKEEALINFESAYFIYQHKNQLAWANASF